MATATQLTQKFVTDGTGFDLELGDLSTFYGGLEALIGPPNPNVFTGMRFEHTGAADSTQPFLMPNKKAHTTSEIEWQFVVEPSKPLRLDAARTGLLKDKFEPYPYSPETYNPGLAAFKTSRQPLPFEHFEAHLKRLNTQLVALSEPEVIKEEVWAARLYSGPMCPDVGVREWPCRLRASARGQGLQRRRGRLRRLHGPDGGVPEWSCRLRACPPGEGRGGRRGQDQWFHGIDGGMPGCPC